MSPGAGVEACKHCAEGYVIEEWKCVSSCSQGFYATQQGSDSKICRRYVSLNWNAHKEMLNCLNMFHYSENVFPYTS